MNIQDINFKQKSPRIFAEIAEEAAKEIKAGNRNNNSQLRKFYDELVMWNEKVQLSKDNRNQICDELLPFIKMMKAKTAYAEGRKHIDDKFRNIFNHCIDQIDSPESLRDAKLFMEAVMGYCKYFGE